MAGKGRTMRKVTRGLALLMVCAFSAGALADELLMKNGSRIIGTLKNSVDGKVEFETEFAGTISVDADDIETAFTDGEVTVMLNDGRVIENQRIATAGDEMVVMSAENEAIVFDVEDVGQLNPEPWQLGRGYKWFGDARIALLLERGNTETDELRGSANSTWRSLKDRYSIAASYEYDEANGVRSKNKWRWRNKYDRFTANSDNYFGVLLGFEGDEFIDLDLRTTFGPYIGRQFLETKLLSVRGEVGLVYVDEQYDVQEDNDYPGANWGLHLTSDYFGGDSTFYVDHDGILNFDETDALVLNTTIGISFPLVYGLEAGLEIKYEYDGGVADEVEDLDETYNFVVGYSW
ncbi:DUF481 domain-containing protein [Halieaceae bacterium IMCC14734]|uniref:DUF481 domain-containing protein n=2 Tax=Candidatus Litorirhabdus singularis TaxID=2518993 RepID=A0ABT3TDH8_9GAMM|nr:DUF481 domain-containing protein [Candidatus Litorirhabdus singularis]